MKVFMPGTKVVTISNRVDGEITSFSVSFLGITYEIQYFYGGEFKKVWMNESQFTVDKNKKSIIGFKSV